MKYLVWRKQLTALQGVIDSFDEAFEESMSRRNYDMTRKPLIEALQVWYSLESSCVS